MANKIILKKSAVSSKIPTSSDLDYGELALNYADGKLYYKKTDNSIHSIVEGAYLFSYSSSAPIEPGAGDRWIDSTTGIEYTYIDDGDSTQWIETGGSVTPPLPLGGQTGQILAKATSYDYDVEWTTPQTQHVYAQVSGTSITTVDSWDAFSHRSCKYIIQIAQGTDYQSSELLVIHDDVTTYKTEYAIVTTNGSLATITTDISAGDVRLRVTLASSSPAVINMKRTLITA